MDQIASPTPKLAAQKQRDMAWFRREWQELRDEGLTPRECVQLAAVMIAQAIVDCPTQVEVLQLCERLGPLMTQAVNMGTGLQLKEHKDGPRIVVASRVN